MAVFGLMSAAGLSHGGQAFASRVALAISAAGVVGSVVVWRRVLRRRHVVERVFHAEEIQRSKRGLPLAFAHKCGWLACRDTRAEDVIAKVGLSRAERVDWYSGIGAVFTGRRRASIAFVSPPLDGWVLVVSKVLAEDQELAELARGASEALGTTVLAFASHRVTSSYQWIRAEQGRLVRAYVSVDGAVVRDEGDASLDGLTRGEAVDEETVLAVAGRWSLNPAQLGAWSSPVGPGWKASW